MEKQETKPFKNRYTREKKTYHKRGDFFFRKKVCLICQKKLECDIDYKNIFLLQRFISEKGRILSRRLTGACAKHQRLLMKSIKQARKIAFIPFTQ